MNKKDLKYYYNEVETTNSFSCLIEIGEELFSVLKNNDCYMKRVQAFYEYFQRDDYVNAFNSFLETTIKLIREKYEISIEDEPYLKVKFPVCTDIINTLFDEMCISDGLINAYISISLPKECDRYKHAIGSFNSKNDMFKDIDYFLFDVMFNSTNEKYYYKYAKEMDDALLISSMKNDKSLLNMLKIILLKMLKENVCFVDIKKITKENLLNKKELEILKARKFWYDIRVKPTYKNIGAMLSMSEGSVNQYVNRIKLELGANSIDDAIRILESEEYNYRFEE